MRRSIMVNFDGEVATIALRAVFYNVVATVGRIAFSHWDNIKDVFRLYVFFFFHHAFII
jgi:hypothetical protein